MTTTTAPTRATPATSAPRKAPRPGFGAALRWEIRKLRAQLRAKAVLVGALVLPVAVVVIIHGQSRPPKDTLFGRFATDNGFALALLVLGVRRPVGAAAAHRVVAGDIFASEDQHGTWKTVLTRSTSRAQLFWAKTLAASRLRARRARRPRRLDHRRRACSSSGTSR